MAVVFEDLQPSLKVTCYLMRASIDDPEDALNQRSKPGGREGMTRLDPASLDLPEGTRAYLSANRETQPVWASALSHHFPELQAVKNVSSRLVLFLPVAGRFFAICFGYGASSLRSGAIDPNFGLRYAARTFDPDVIFGLDSRRMSATARTQAVQTIAGERLADLDIPLMGEFVRRLAGQLDAGAAEEINGISAVIASDGVSFKAPLVLSQIQDVLKTMMDVVVRVDAKAQFEFVDALETIRATDDRAIDLDEELCAELNALVDGDNEDGGLLIGLVPPESPFVDILDTVKCRIGPDVYVLPELSLSGLIDVMTEHGRRFSRTALKGIRLSVVDENGDESRAESLKAWLVYEVTREGERFILTLGRWYSLNGDFARQLDADLASIDDATAELQLPEWSGSQNSETVYNRDVGAAGDNPYLSLDTVKFFSNGDQVEACDLLSLNGDLIHVKRWDKSATLSHLFSQGLVALEVLNRDEQYLKDVEDYIDAVSNRHLAGFQSRPRKVVYAVAVRGARQLPGGLPTFSKVNLRDFAQRIRGRGADVAIARVQML